MADTDTKQREKPVYWEGEEVPSHILEPRKAAPAPGTPVKVLAFPAR